MPPSEGPVDFSKNIYTAAPQQSTQYQSRQILGPSVTPKIITTLVRLSNGRVRTEEQAAYIILGTVVVSLIFAAYFFFVAFKSAAVHENAKQIFSPSLPTANTHAP